MNSELLEQQLKSADFVLLTQRQLEKDFSAVGFPFDAPFEQEAHSTTFILKEIQHQLQQIEKQSSSTFHQLLYQIDVPENMYIEALSSEDPMKQLAEIILRREAYKVYLRSRF